jgi:PAS domain S-box-containing protein
MSEDVLAGKGNDSIGKESVDASAYSVLEIERIRLELERAARVLNESEETYRLLAETASDAIIQIDENSIVQFVNSAATRIFGYQVEELIGHSLTQIMPPELREGHRLGMMRYLATGERKLNWASMEIPALHKDGHVFPLEISFGESKRDGKSFFIGVARDITDRRRAEDALRESEQRLRTMADSIPQLAWMAEPDGYRFWYNQKWYDYTGTTFEEVKGRGWQSVHHPDILPRVLEEWDRAIETGEPFSMEFPLRAANGSYRWFLTRVNPLRDSSGQIVRWFGTNTDIEERRSAEDALRQNQLLLTLAMQSSGMGAWQRDVLTGQTWWSEELEEIFGLEKGGFAGTDEDFYKLIHEDDREMSRSVVERAIAERRAYSFEFRFYHSSGEVRWMEGRGQAVYSESGEPVKLYGVGIDITERKKAGEKARFLAELDRAVQQIAEPDEVMAVTARMLADHLGTDRCAYAEIEDERIFVITGDYTRGVPSIVGRWPVEAFGEECARQMLANEAYVVFDTDTDPRIGPRDLPAYRATTIRSVICVPLHKEGKFTAAMAVHQSRPRTWTSEEIDLVELVVSRCWESIERTRASRATRLSDERFRLALSSGAVTVYEQDADLRYKWVFPTAPYRPDVIGKTDEELSPDVGGDRRTELKKRVLETGESLRGEVSAIVGDSEYWYDLLVEPRRDDAGNIIGVGGTALDITERRKLEESFAQSEERFRALMEQAPFSIQLFDKEGRTVRVNRAWEELWGVTIEELGDYNILEDPQLEKAGIAKGIRKAFEGEAQELPPIRYDPNETLPGLSKNEDAVRWTSAVIYPLKDSGGRVREVALVHQDITAKKRVENRLAEQKRLLESLTESVLDGILIVSPTGSLLHYNQRFLEVWNMPAHVIEQNSDEAALAWAAKQTDNPQAFLARVIEIYSQPDLRVREEVRMKNGSVFERFGAPVEHEGERLGWVWSFRDITERKQMEEALERHGEELEATVRQRTRELSETNKGLKLENQKRRKLEVERLKLLAAITTAQEDERRRMALDLHDHFGQQLTALRLRIGVLGVRTAGDDGFGDLIEEIQELVSRLDSDVDALAWGLRPPSLDDIGLAASLGDYISEWSRRFGIPVRFDTSRFGRKRLAASSETHLYRITQEILTNIFKHAKAESVDITLERRDGSVKLTVTDNGVGFEPKKHKPSGGSGLGLIGMRERAAILGGSTEIDSRPGKGTTIVVTIPE